MPSDKTTFDVTAKMMRVVMRVIPKRETPNPAEYMTPLKVFL